MKRASFLASARARTARGGATLGTIAFLLATAVVVVAPAGAVSGDALPRRLVHLPMPVDPLDAEGPLPLRAELWWLELPDDRVGRLHRVSAWGRVGSAHAFRVSMDYVGLEGADVFQYGGGRFTTRWTTRIGGVGQRGVALDVSGNLPIGVPSLHPLSTQSSQLQLRVRVTPIGGRHWRAWLGWWARRVSPPEDDVRAAPRSWFPSGSGVDGVVHLFAAGIDWELSWELELGGLPDTQMASLRGDLPLARDLAVQVGAIGGFGPQEDRQLDFGWSVGLTWRPSSLGDDEGAPATP